MFLSSFIPQSGQTITFDIFSIVFLLIILIALIVNIKKGFIGALISLLASVGSIIIALLICKPLGTAMLDTSLGVRLVSSIEDWISQQGDGALDIIINSENMDIVLAQVYEQLHIPAAIQDTITKIIAPMITQEGENLVQLLSHSLAMYALIAICFLVSWLVLFIIFKLLGLLTRKINKVPFVGFANRLLGGIFGLCTGCIICFAICYGLSFLFTLDISFNETIKNMMQLNNEDAWTFSKALYENNLIQILIETYL